MALTFKGKLIPGSHGPIQFVSPELQFRRGRYWQVKGTYEVMGRVGGRPLMVDHTLHFGFDTTDKLYLAIRDLDKLLGQNGTLSETGNITKQHDNCTFERYEMIPLEGQPVAGPLQDVAETLFDDEGEGDGGWFITLQLYFYQLLVPNV